MICFNHLKEWLADKCLGSSELPTQENTILSIFFGITSILSNIGMLSIKKKIQFFKLAEVLINNYRASGHAQIAPKHVRNQSLNAITKVEERTTVLGLGLVGRKRRLGKGREGGRV